MQISKRYEDIILVGPMCSGKTTIARHIAAITNLSLVNVDAIKYDFFTVLGYKEEVASHKFKKGGIHSLLEYEKKFEQLTLTSILQNWDKAIFDIGAGFLFDKECNPNSGLLKLLECFPNTFLVLPSLNVEKSCQILAERLKIRFLADPELQNYMSLEEGNVLNREFVEQYISISSNFKLLLSSQKTLESIAREVYARLR